MTDHECIRVSVDGAVATLTLHRPERLNAYTTQMGIEIYAAIGELDRRPDVRAIIVTGEGRAFCAGADLEPGGDTFARERAWQAAADLEARVRPWNLSTPIIAAINGPAVGIGATLPLHWDLRIASERAKIGFVFTRRGILPEANSTWILPRLVGLAKAMDLLLTGRHITAAEAREFGLIGHVVPDGQALARALEIAEVIASNGPLAVQAILRSIRATEGMPENEAFAVDTRIGIEVFLSEDAREGPRAFKEKRTPQFKMR